MRILQIVNAFYPAFGYGGTVKVAYDLSRQLVQSGHDVTVFTTDTVNANMRQNARYLEIEGLKVFYFKNISNTLAWRRYFFPPEMISQLKAQIKTFDIVHIHGFRHFPSVFVHHYAKKYGIPYVLQAHGSLPRIMEKQGLKRLYDWIWGDKILKDASRLIAVSKVEVEQYKKMGVDDSKISLIPNGLEIKRQENPPSYGQFKERYGIKKKHMILFLGRLHKIKGVDFLIKSFGRLVKEMEDVSLVIVGPDDGYKTYLEKLVNELDLKNGIRFIGYIENAVEAYLDADVLVYPAVYEIFGLVPFEAIICGTPVIVTDDCGCGELVKKVNCGYLVKYGDVNDLKEKMKHVLENPDEGREMVERGKKYIVENLTWDKVVRKVEEVYEDCIQGY